jgi:2-hydroxychromene-2-carboxylate isomerase
VPLERISDTHVKSSLRVATELAALKGVFGVPTLSIDEQLFWGNDSVDFAAAYVHDPGILDTEEMRRIDSLPVAAART